MNEKHARDNKVIINRFYYDREIKVIKNMLQLSNSNDDKYIFNSLQFLNVDFVVTLFLL